MQDAVTYLVGLVALLILWRGVLWRGRPLPGVTRSPPWAIGHRGVIAAPPAPAENTMASFRRALDAGLDGIETDVQLTRDGVLVLVHDEVVSGVSVPDASFETVSAVLPSVARLDELLDLVGSAPGTVLNVELKTKRLASGKLARRVARALRDSAVADRVIVSSFNPVALAHLRLTAPSLRTAYLWHSGPSAPRALRSPWPAGWLHVDALHPHRSAVDGELVRRAAARDLLVNVWTVNDVAEVDRLHGLGVSGIVGDDPDVLLGATRGGPS